MFSKKAIDILIELEGGYVNNPNDPGGETKYGISKRSYPNEDIRNLTVQRAHELYKRDFWDKIKGDLVPWPMNLLLFDMAVHSGPDRAIKTAQKAFKLTQDGVIGPRTLNALKAATVDSCADFMRERLSFLSSLNKPYYINGWINRLFKLSLRC